MTNILSILTPEGLFSQPDVSIIKKEYREYVKLWHPDRCNDPSAEEIFNHITILYHQALKQVDNGIWHFPGIYEFNDIEGKKYRLSYQKKHDFEIGEMYICNSYVLFVIPKSFNNRFKRGIEAISKFKFASDNMKKEMIRWLPHVRKILSSVDHNFLLIDKSANQFLLKDLYDYYGYKKVLKENGGAAQIPAVHIAWIMSSLMNICCYLDWAKLSHNAISMDTVFVSPKGHAAYLYGGWWWSEIVGNILTQVPIRTANLMPNAQKSNKLATVNLDLEMIRALARELFNDPSGANLYSRKDIPTALANWLTGTTSGNALNDYRTWRLVLEKSWGKPKFHKMDVHPEEMYE